ncbi:MAG TPA: serine/threonine-protein kinase [Nannocystaceae bacterium]|nr:serine/threonine-protein kinase [Nannocystaceae bacterium]
MASESDVVTQAPSIGGQLMAASLERSLFGNDTAPVRLGRFVIVDRIAGGGMGVVYRAFDPELGRAVALKVLAAGREHLTERMRREAQTLARLSHPNVVTVYEAGVDAGRVYVAMELVEGGTLREWCERNPPGTRARFQRMLALAVQAVRGLAAAHDAGLVHRDLKPSNMLIDGEERLRIADFGLARMRDDPRDATPHGDASPRPAEDLTATGEVLGTPAYMPPEQFVGTSDARSDQWSLCASFWEAAYGERWDPDRVVRRADVPTWFHDVLVRGLSEAPHERYPDARTLLHELERRRGLRAPIVAGVGVAIGAVVFAFAMREQESPCFAAKAGLADVWDRERVTGKSQVVLERLDAYAERWREGVHEVCERARARGELTAGDDPLELPSRAMECHRSARAQLLEVTEQLAAADSDTRARVLVHALPSLAHCVDARVGAAEDLGAGRDAAATLARVQVALHTQDYAAARRGVAEANAALVDLDLPGLSAEAAIVETTLADWQDRIDDQEAAAERALEQAEVAGDPHLTARAWILVADVEGDRKRYDVAELAIARARSYTKIVGDPPWLIAQLRGSESRVAVKRGDYRRAHELGREAVAYERELDDPLGVAAQALRLVDIALLAGDALEARALAQEAAQIYARELGDTHVETARARLMEGWMAVLAGDTAASLAPLRVATDVLAATDEVPPDDRCAAHVMLGNALMQAKQLDEARTVVARGIRLAADLGASEHMRCTLLGLAGGIEVDAGKYDAAIALLVEARTRLARLEDPSAHTYRVAPCGNLADAYAKAGRFAEAGATQDECMKELELLPSDAVPLRGEALRYAGDRYRQLGRLEDARKSYRAALDVLARGGGNPEHSEAARVALAELDAG